jgi:hydrogenase nickel incorporation protein HypB
MTDNGVTNISIVTNILKANDCIAAENRKTLEDSGAFAINILGSPGAGKTAFLEACIPYLLKNGLKVGVIFGDITTTNDAKRISVYKVPVVQIMTEAFGGSCHLDAPMIRKAFEKINLDGLDVLFIENVGNLVCPAVFDIGEHGRILVLSVTEGEDKPLKYPVIFQRTDLVIINKVDLLPHLDVDLDLIHKNIKSVNSKCQVLEFSKKENKNLDSVLNWLKKIHNRKI